MSETAYELKKYSGTGNTFVLINLTDPDKDFTHLAKELCEREDVDGLLVMQDSSQADIRMRIINRDGSEAEMCGNGSRCAAHWAHHVHGLPGDFTMETMAGILNAGVKGDVVKVRLTDPSSITVIDEVLDEKFIGKTLFINTGVPHAVSEVSDITAIDPNKIGSKIRYHEVFQPKGTNAVFYQKTGDRIVCRVYERGVESETQSCGTGSAAAAIIASFKYDMKSPVAVRVQSGEELSIYFDRSGDAFTNIYLEGRVDTLPLMEDSK